MNRGPSNTMTAAGAAATAAVATPEVSMAGMGLSSGAGTGTGAALLGAMMPGPGIGVGGDGGGSSQSIMASDAVITGHYVRTLVASTADGTSNASPAGLVRVLRIGGASTTDDNLLDRRGATVGAMRMGRGSPRVSDAVLVEAGGMGNRGLLPAIARHHQIHLGQTDWCMAEQRAHQLAVLDHGLVFAAPHGYVGGNVASAMPGGVHDMLPSGLLSSSDSTSAASSISISTTASRVNSPRSMATRNCGHDLILTAMGAMTSTTTADSSSTDQSQRRSIARWVPGVGIVQSRRSKASEGNVIFTGRQGGDGSPIASTALWARRSDDGGCPRGSRPCGTK